MDGEKRGIELGQLDGGREGLHFLIPCVVGPTPVRPRKGVGATYEEI